MPIAQTGPRLAVDPMVATIRPSMPTVTVPAEAMIAGADPRSAAAIALCRSS